MTSNNAPEEASSEMAVPRSVKAVDDQLIEELVGRAQAEGLQLAGEGGLQQLTKRLLESALEGEVTDHLGYDRHDPAGKDGGNARNGTRSKTVLTEVGPVEIAVPRDRDGSFEPKIVKKRQRRLTGVDEMIISLAAKGLTTGEVQAHLAEVYGTDVSRQTISTITDKVLEGMAEWQNRPLDPVYPVIFIDAIHVKIRDGAVTNRPVYVALAVTTEGRRDILGLWAGDGGEGAKHWLNILTEIKNRGPTGRGNEGPRKPPMSLRPPGVCPISSSVLRWPAKDRANASWVTGYSSAEFAAQWFRSRAARHAPGHAAGQGEWSARCDCSRPTWSTAVTALCR